MTTIAFKDSRMAGDGLITQGDRILVTNFKKVIKESNILLGLAGNPDLIIKLKDILKKGDGKTYKNTLDLISRVLDDRSEALVYNIKTKLLTSHSYTGYLIIEEKEYAIGSGSSYANTAMFLGESAKDAVSAASEFDIRTNNNITEVK